nr:retrovirus-related Pol polyprotein from transposon TNT 1-94 [Tanacetum cinerariifolium]
MFAKQSILRNPPKFDETHALSKTVTSNLIPTPQESKVMNNDKVIAPGMFRINPFKTFREEKHVPKTVRASVRTKPITVSQPPIFTKKDVNSDSNGLSSTGIDNTKTRRPHPRSNTKNDRVLSASTSSCNKNKEVEVEEHHTNLLLYKNTKHMSSACSSKHMTRNQKLLINFVWKFMGTVRFGNDLEVAFRRNACFFRNIEGVDLLKGGRSTNHYTINIHDMASASPICLMAHASSTKSWLWHQRLSHLNFDTIIDLAKNDLVSGLPKFKYHKEHLCPSCEQGKSKRASHPPKLVPNSRQRLHLLHMDLCGPMKITSIDGKRVGISHQMSSVRTPQQNGVVERRNWTLVEAARTMLIFSHASLFLWAKVIDPACFTQNRSIIHHHFNKTPYELINGRKTDISFLHVFGALYYPKNDREDIRKLGAKGNIGFFIGYSADSCAYRIYNRRAKKIMNTMNVSFDELSAMAFEQRSSKPRLQSMTSGQISSGLDLTYALPTITSQQPTEGELDLLFEAMYDDFIGGQPSFAQRTDVDELNSQQQHAQQQGNQDHLQFETVDDNIPNTMFDGNTFWTKDYPLEQVTGEPSRPVLTRNQLRSDGDICMYTLMVSFMETKNVKEAMTDPAWIESMYEELFQFKRLDVWVLVPAPDNISPLTLKWLFKNKHDEEKRVIRNKSRLVVRGYRQEEGIDFEESFSPAKPTVKHLKEVKRIFCYLWGTINSGLWYTKDSGFELTGFSDVDYAGCKESFKSTSDGAQFLGEKLVSWSSKKQDYTALSTAEAEYVSLSACCAQVLWMRTQLTDYDFHFKKIPIYCDSKSAIAISYNPVQQLRTKHITVRYHFIKEHVEKGMIELYFIKTDYQLADIFTKALLADRFNYLVCCLVMNGNPSRVNIKQLCGRIRRWRYNLILAESRFKTPCSIIKDKYMMKAQIHVSKSFGISDVQALPQKEHYQQNLPNNTIMSNKMSREIVSELSRS